MSPRSRWVSVAVVLATCGGTYIVDQHRTRHILATEEMTWKCYERTDQYLRPVVFLYFVRAPEYYTFHTDPKGNFCAFVRHSGHPAVRVTADVSGTKASGMRGWSEVDLDGRPFPIGPDFGGDGAQGTPMHDFPYAEDFGRAVRRHIR